VEYKVEDGKIYSVSPIDSVNGKELTSTTETKWYEQNGENYGGESEDGSFNWTNNSYEFNSSLEESDFDWVDSISEQRTLGELFDHRLVYKGETLYVSGTIKVYGNTLTFKDTEFKFLEINQNNFNDCIIEVTDDIHDIFNLGFDTNRGVRDSGITHSPIYGEVEYFFPYERFRELLVSNGESINEGTLFHHMNSLKESDFSWTDDIPDSNELLISKSFNVYIPKGFFELDVLSDILMAEFPERGFGLTSEEWPTFGDLMVITMGGESPVVITVDKEITPENTWSKSYISDGNGVDTIHATDLVDIFKNRKHEKYD
jgi:hypothetical protein